MFFRGKKDKAYYEDSLREVFAIDSFHESQWDVIRRLLKKKRILLIEKTGFGKSLCYQFPATQIDGVTLVFSPLISLMRDQVTQMNDLNIPSTMIFGGQSPEEKAAILESSKKGKYKLLYIAPERQETEAWNELMSSLNVGMIVVDEAHCISEWGHDFRPAYQKIIETVSCVNKKIPILATTATATDSVIKDVLSQIGRAKVLRGSLNRPMFELSVVRVLDDMAKYCYLKENAERWDGVGLIYCRTRSDTECYAAFLRSMGINAMAYHGGMS
ncbi:MAG: RecQ family ATP-dependent DNA helicase, partial [Spirochaetota bacterium]|nr:RecQ family ATP-dependent DNA helicase [Spirochaetota bacterium]